VGDRGDCVREGSNWVGQCIPAGVSEGRAGRGSSDVCQPINKEAPRPSRAPSVSAATTTPGLALEPNPNTRSPSAHTRRTAARLGAAQRCSISEHTHSIYPWVGLLTSIFAHVLPFQIIPSRIRM
jgi:hypothetical protein